jgi:hypothetical protein
MALFKCHEQKMADAEPFLLISETRRTPINGRKTDKDPCNERKNCNPPEDLSHE